MRSNAASRDASPVDDGDLHPGLRLRRSHASTVPPCRLRWQPRAARGRARGGATDRRRRPVPAQLRELSYRRRRFARAGTRGAARRAPQSIVESLVNGAMRVQGARLSGAERRAVAEFLTGRTIGGDVSGAGSGRCTAADAPRRGLHQGEPLERLGARGLRHAVPVRGRCRAHCGGPAEALAQMDVRLSRTRRWRGRSRR